LEDPLIHPSGDKSLIKIRFSQTISTTTNGYDGQFRVLDDAVEVFPTSVERDPADDTAVLVTLSSAVTGTASVSYGDVVAAGLGITLSEVIKGANDLPAPRFGPLDVVMDSSLVHGWHVY